MNELMPALMLLLGAVGIAAGRGLLRDAFVLGGPLLALLAVLMVPDGVILTGQFLSVTVDRWRARRCGACSGSSSA